MMLLELFARGHPLIMLFISGAGIGVIYCAVKLWRKDAGPRYARALLLIGSLALLIGMLGQALGLIQMINVIEGAEHVPPALVTGGITNTFIPLVYGSFWFVLALLVRYIKS